MTNKNQFIILLIWLKRFASLQGSENVTCALR